MYLLVCSGARRGFFFLSLEGDLSFDPSGLLLLLVKILDLFVCPPQSASLNPFEHSYCQF